MMPLASCTTFGTPVTPRPETGASLAELMKRMGHSSTRAARIYLHARQERDKKIASTLGKMAARELKRSQKPMKQDGTEAESRSGAEAKKEPMKREVPASGTMSRTEASWRLSGVTGIEPALPA
ncbi:hypothetical protein [Actinoallomurus acaciae]|uniref:Phage integrase family protein n=1 Tax=Actinoallomurus acaciae TaxID=502577 RepID=A0ABV5YIL3_9ACTN